MTCRSELFTTEMRQATRKVHSISDTLVNSKLLIALSDESVWADAILVFYEVFKRLEDIKEEIRMPEIEELYVDKVLLRTNAFVTDLDRYYGMGWQDTYIKRSEVIEYLDHLQELKEERPILLLAYVYHLTMGLLSGGQIIQTKRRLREITMTSLFMHPSNSLALNENYRDAVTDFSGSDIDELKKSMKSAMNKIALNWTQEQRCALINESQMVFTYNNSIIKTVKGTSKAVMWKFFYVLIAIKLVLITYYFYF